MVIKKTLKTKGLQKSYQTDKDRFGIMVLDNNWNPGDVIGCFRMAIPGFGNTGERRHSRGRKQHSRNHPKPRFFNNTKYRKFTKSKSKLLFRFGVQFIRCALRIPKA